MTGICPGLFIVNEHRFNYIVKALFDLTRVWNRSLTIVFQTVFRRKKYILRVPGIRIINTLWCYKCKEIGIRVIHFLCFETS